MQIVEVQVLRDKLQDDIIKLVADFERVTNTKISSIEISKKDGSGGVKIKTIEVEVKL